MAATNNSAAAAQAAAWLEQFFTDQLVLHGLATTTALALRLEIALWERWLNREKLLWPQVDANDISRWLESLQHLAHTTVNRKAWALRSLYRWAVDQKLIEHDPWLKIQRPIRRASWIPAYTPTVKAVELLLAQPDTSTARGIRDRAILELLYSTGLRAQELLALAVWQVQFDREHRVIRIRGKGGHERLVIYGEVAAFWLERYVNVARPRLSPRAAVVDALWLNDAESELLLYGALLRMVKHHACRAGYPLIRPHSLRHAFATHLYEGGANLRAIQMLLGHACLSTTAGYAKATSLHLTRLIDEHHPRGTKFREHGRELRLGQDQEARPRPMMRRPEGRSSPVGDTYR